MYSGCVVDLRSLSSTFELSLRLGSGLVAGTQICGTCGCAARSPKELVRAEGPRSIAQKFRYSSICASLSLHCAFFHRFGGNAYNRCGQQWAAVRVQRGPRSTRRQMLRQPPCSLLQLQLAHQRLQKSPQRNQIARSPHINCMCVRCVLDYQFLEQTVICEMNQLSFQERYILYRPWLRPDKIWARGGLSQVCFKTELCI